MSAPIPAWAGSVPAPGPIAPDGRVASMDVLRGVAVLGILLMNVTTFALPMMAYVSPLHDGSPFEGASRAAWWVQHLFADQKFISIFSMLFGAGLVMMDQRWGGGAGVQPGFYYRRLAWLFVIGMVHAYLVWYGDILVAYALCGLALYPLRRVRAGWLIAIGTIVMMVSVVISGVMGAGMIWMERAAGEAQAALDAGRTLSSDQQGILEGYRQMQQGMTPPPDEVRRQIEAYRGSPLEVLKQNAGGAVFMQTFIFAIFTLWRCLGLMLVGMGLAKLGVFAAARSTRFYALLALAGLGLGLPLVVWGALRLISSGFDMSLLYAVNGHFNYVGSAGVALGYVGLVMLAVKRGWLAWLTTRLAAVGRMALSNYLAQSLLGVLVYYGWGLGLHAQGTRAQAMIFVAAVWVLQLFWSPWWLACFRFGPAEWLWRSLTYGRRQPMRVVPAATAG